jgi:hypothetical protein
VRTFGEQIAHAAGSNPFFLGAAWKAPSRFAADTGRGAQPAGLPRPRRRRLRRVRPAWCARRPEAQLAGTGTFANMTKTNWRWVATALEAHDVDARADRALPARQQRHGRPQYLPF